MTDRDMKMRKFSSLAAMESAFILSIRNVLKYIPEMINEEYSIADWTYTKLALGNMDDTNLMRILDLKISALRHAFEESRSLDEKKFWLVDSILFLIAWYVMHFSEEWWSASFKKQKMDEVCSCRPTDGVHYSDCPLANS